MRVKINESLYLRDPEQTELGQKIVRQAISMIDEIGFEDFTFKKLAAQINTTEAGVYRYFENKHRLLIYIVTWYWNLLEYRVVFHLNNMTDPEKKIRKVIELLSGDMEDGLVSDMDHRALFRISIAESNKTYLNKAVTANNQALMFKPYKDLCARIAALITEFNAAYPFPRSLSSSLLEVSHFQHFFMNHLPSLTDFGVEKDEAKLRSFLETLVFSNIKK